MERFSQIRGKRKAYKSTKNCFFKTISAPKSPSYFACGFRPYRQTSAGPRVCKLAAEHSIRHLSVSRGRMRKGRGPFLAPGLGRIRRWRIGLWLKSSEWDRSVARLHREKRRKANRTNSRKAFLEWHSFLNCTKERNEAKDILFRTIQNQSINQSILIAIEIFALVCANRGTPTHLATLDTRLESPCRTAPPFRHRGKAWLLSSFPFASPYPFFLVSSSLWSWPPRSSRPPTPSSAASASLTRLSESYN